MWAAAAGRMLPAMSTPTTHTTGSSAAQSELWGVRPRDWARWRPRCSPSTRPCWTASASATAPSCSTPAVAPASRRSSPLSRGAVVNGLDATAALLAIAAERVPNGEFAVG